MNQLKPNKNWTTCLTCKGSGKKKQRVRKKLRLAYKKALHDFEEGDQRGEAPLKPKGTFISCSACKGSGLHQAEKPVSPDTENLPHLAIIGAGIGGAALAVACLHRGIPFTLYERDKSFDERSQGYGLTLQQASKALEAFGILELEEGIISTRHVVHTPDGKIVGEWGMRKWQQNAEKKTPKRTNIHIARQNLRLAFLHQLSAKYPIQWGHKLVSLKNKTGMGVELQFETKDEIKTVRADLVVGADGIRSTVRKHIIPAKTTPLRYLNCLVVLGICKLKNLENKNHDLLDGASVFQTANGHERIYMMPYDKESVMWQLSFPMTENEAKQLSEEGPKSLKKEAIKRTPWHAPIPDILEATPENLITGYPVYDRALLQAQQMESAQQITLLGDAAHPMSPFKGQGANQALLDALSLARSITRHCRPKSNWREAGIRKSVLNEFENEMLARTATKVKDSAAAAEFLHTDIVLHESNQPRGKVTKRTKK